MNNFRIGFGYDVHQLAENYILTLGGIKIPHHKGCVAHSDGDVAIHAICDALLGAANQRDIGFHFPDNDNQYKGIDSKILLKKVVDILNDNSYLIGNIDVTICLQTPKLSGFIPEMTSVLAATMQIENSQVNIKATTTEKLGFVGSEKGVAVYAIALIYKNL